MKHLFALVAMLAVAVMASATLAAHEVTFKGTVVSVEPGKIVKVKVNVVDAATKKTTAMTFELDDETKIFRGNVAVKLVDAKIEKGEQIAVTVDHDESAT